MLPSKRPPPPGATSTPAKALRTEGGKRIDATFVTREIPARGVSTSFSDKPVLGAGAYTYIAKPRGYCSHLFGIVLFLFQVRRAAHVEGLLKEHEILTIVELVRAPDLIWTSLLPKVGNLLPFLTEWATMDVNPPCLLVCALGRDMNFGAHSVDRSFHAIVVWNMMSQSHA